MGITKYSSGGIPSIGSWNNLSNLEPAIEGLQRRVIVPGSSRSGYALAQRFSDKWDVVGADSLSISYIQNNPIPLTAPTIPQRRQFLGKSLAIQGSTYDIDTLTSAFAGGSASSCSFARQLNNITGRTISSIRIMIPVISTSGAATISARIANMGGGSIDSPAGSWSQVTWSSATSITPADNAGNSPETPTWIMSDDITITGNCSPGGSIILWWGCSGGVSKVMTFPADNKQESSSFVGMSKFINGDYGTSGTPTWLNVDLGGLDIQILATFTTTESSSTVVNIVAIGDSTFAEIVPFTTTAGDGWTTQATQLAATNNKKWAIRSWGQGTFTMTQSLNRLQSLYSSGILQYVDVVVMQGWSWNDRTMGALGLTSSLHNTIHTARTLVETTAGRGFAVLTLSPPGQRDAASDPIPTQLDTVDLTAYDTMDSLNTSYMGSKYANVQSSVWDSTNHRIFGAANSLDNVHANIDVNIGQNLQAAAVYTAFTNTVIPALGYSI